MLKWNADIQIKRLRESTLENINKGYENELRFTYNYFLTIIQQPTKCPILGQINKFVERCPIFGHSVSPNKKSSLLNKRSMVSMQLKNHMGYVDRRV
jgi:hypothetical protein